MASGENTSTFIFYNSEDGNGAEAHELKFRICKRTCQTDNETCLPGISIVKSLHECIHKTGQIIIFVTNKSAQKGLFNFAALSSLENIMFEKHMRLYIAYKEASMDDVRFLKSGLLSLTPSQFFDLNTWKGTDSLLKRLKSYHHSHPFVKRDPGAYHHSHPFVKRDPGEPRIEDLCSYYDDANHIQVNVRLVMKNTCTDEEWKFIKKAYDDLYKCIEDGFQTNLECFVVYEPGPLRLTNLLPAGNVHFGLVYSHVSGFMGFVAEELIKYFKTNKSLFRKFLLIVPEDCNVPQDLVTADDSEGEIVISHDKWDELEFKRVHADKQIIYTATVYRIKCGTEEYHVCAQVPTVLKAISHLAQNHLGKIDVQLEQQRFCQSYQQILDAKRWNDIVQIVTCKDEAGLPSALFKVAKSLANSLPGNLQPHGSNQATTKVSSVYLYNSSTDLDILDEIRNELDIHHIPNKTNLPGESILSGGDNREGWIVFVLSKESLESSDTSFNVLKCITADVDEGRLGVLLVLRGDLDISDVPQCFRWVTYYRAKWVGDTSYTKRIVRTVSGYPVDIGRKLPAGNVVPGLCWAYFINYLMITLTSDLDKTIQIFLRQKNVECGCIRKLIVVWVKSCDTEKQLHHLASERAVNRKMTHTGQFQTPTNGFGGQKVRPFNLNVYEFADNSNPDKKVRRWFPAEYCTPMACLQTMETDFAGISTATKENIGPMFKKLFDEIVSRDHVKQTLGDNKVSLIYFDDQHSAIPLIDLLEKEIMDPEATVIY